MGGNNYCSIPGCRSTRKKAKTEGKKISLFALPSNKEELEKWRKAVEKVDKKVGGAGYKICELHFTKDSIVRYYETLLPDGTVWRIEKGRIGLKDGAVPTIFPNLQNVGVYGINSQSTNQPNSQNNQRKRKSSKTFNSTISPKKVKTYLKILPENKVNKFNGDPETAEAIENEKLEQTSIVLNEMTETEETIENFEKASLVLNEMTETFTYDTLVNNLEFMPKPNVLWGISIHDEFVMCAKWNEDCTLMKRIIVDCNLRIQVFLENRAIDFDNVKISNIKHLSYILQEVDKYGICINANNIGKTGCDGYVLPKVHGNRCRYCLIFGNNETNRNRVCYWLSKGRNFNKLQTLYDKINTLTNNNALLKAQINKIMKIKAIWKVSNKTNQNPITR